MVGAALFEASQLKPKKKNNKISLNEARRKIIQKIKKLAQCRKNNYDKQKLFWLFSEQFF